jgi:AcrR family transcriptional regulator
MERFAANVAALAGRAPPLLYCRPMSADVFHCDAAAESDGRRRRAIGSRVRVVASLLDLVREGDLAPSAERVAARANVGLRTVFRHFNDMDGLYREMTMAIESELAAALAVKITGADWRERLVGVIGKRAMLYEKIAPFKRAADAHRHKSAFLSAAHARIVAMARAGLEEIVPDAVRDEVGLFETLDLLLSQEAWSRLRREQRLSVQAACATLELAARRLIATVVDPER